jgi:hypothetical protein
MRMSKTIHGHLFTFLTIAWYVSLSYSAKLAEIRIVDKDILMVHILDGEVTHRDDGVGEKAFYNQHHENDMDTVKLYTPALSINAAKAAANWTLSSTDDAAYSSGLHPAQCYLKTKMNGHAEKDWGNSDYNYDYTYEHWIFLKLPQSLQQGKSYTVTIAAETNISPLTGTYTYDIFKSVSEAIHINLAGYHPDPTIKAADLYIWMGDGGARDYSTFVNNKVHLYNVASGQATEVGKVTFWKKSGNDIYSYNLTRSDVWNADFSSFTGTGTYRLAIEGVGCSQEFKIDNNAFHDPFMVSVQGFFYMRIGQDSTHGIRPVPRRPLYIPGVSPQNTTVYLTTMHPWHAQWETFSGGDVWDQPNDWAKFKKSGNPTNSRAFGGHSDALDWDRHLGHIAIIWDMLLPFILTKGALNDDNLDIAESGNGIPDIIDEARNEVDFWLHLRDGQGYSHGVTNPNDKNELFQAAPTAIAAWASAANAAMLADCFRICAKNDLKNEYRDSAIAAFNFANSLPDKMLDKTHGIGDFSLQGKDMRMMAAAFLYNITGDTAYENVVKKESVVSDNNSVIVNSEKINQLYATAAYLFSPQTIHYQELYNNMKASVISQAKSIETDFCSKRPSRRSTAESSWYFRTAQNVHHSIVAHAITANTDEKSLFRKAMILEADYGLGRNPMNMIQMTTASTPLENKRSVPRAYTSGGDDGTPGMHPGHTPYMNLDDWDQGMTMGSPSKLYANCYPANFTNTWPIDEGYFNTSYVWAHNEFTPQQTMRGKMALYGYLYGITKGSSAVSPKRFKINPEHSTALKISYTCKVRILDLCGRVIWSGTGSEYTRAVMEKRFADKVVLINNIDNLKKTIPLLHMY